MRPIRPFFFASMAAALLAFNGTVTSTGSARADEMHGFNVAAVEVPTMPQILSTKWMGVLDRHAVSERRAAAECTDGRGSDCALYAWQSFLADIAARPRAEQMRLVNDYINHYRYVPDSRNWGMSDYWAAPAELFRRGGDCEDYVIAKYLSLRALGVAAHDMRILILHDSQRNLAHAVLVVDDGDDALVLDNLYKRVMTWEAVRATYRPLYSINEESAWIHTARG